MTCLTCLELLGLLSSKDSSLSLFTWWQNGFGSKMGQPPLQKHFMILCWHSIWSHAIGKTSHNQAHSQRDKLQNVVDTSFPTITDYFTVNSEQDCIQNNDRCLLALFAYLDPRIQVAMHIPPKGAMARLL